MRFKDVGKVTKRGKSIKFAGVKVTGDFKEVKGQQFDCNFSMKALKGNVKRRRCPNQTHLYRQVAEYITTLKKGDQLKVDDLGLTTVAKKVAYVLSRNQATRNDDGLLIAEVYHVFYNAKLATTGVGCQSIILDVNSLTLGLRRGGYPAPASIIRVRRHFQRLGYYSANKETQKHRNEAAEAYHKAFVG